MTYKEIINSLIDKKLAVLAGAGISYNSGLPVVSDFYKHFLPLFYDRDDCDYLIEKCVANKTKTEENITIPLSGIEKLLNETASNRNSLIKWVNNK